MAEDRTTSGRRTEGLICGLQKSFESLVGAVLRMYWCIQADIIVHDPLVVYLDICYPAGDGDHRVEGDRPVSGMRPRCRVLPGQRGFLGPDVQHERVIASREPEGEDLAGPHGTLGDGP